MNLCKIVEKLNSNQDLADDELIFLIENNSEESNNLLQKYAQKMSQKYYGKNIYLRGLIEFTNFCKNDCYYCGIRRSNKNAERYRLSKGEILSCCKVGYDLGFRTFVLQGGEDGYFSDDMICSIVYEIHSKYPDCAITLSMGEKSRESYKRFFDSGADRYLLRQETSSKSHYEFLHPKDMSFLNRQRCLYDLKEIGYQVGCGFMVGSPNQRAEDLVKDLRFMQELKPQMIGIGPFVPHNDTPFANYKRGDLELTLKMIGIIRLMFKNVLLPATTSLGTIHPKGREMGILYGANVVMPNLSPLSVRKKYMLYDGKICTGEESAQCRICLEKRLESIGYKVLMSRGDHPDFSK